MGHYYHTNNKNAPLAYAHYSDPTFDKQGGVLIFGRQEKGIQVEYADRLEEWEPEKSSKAREAVTKSHGTQQTAAWIEVYLSHYYARPVDLRYIIAGTQSFSGYPWHVYGFTFKD